MSSGPFSSVDWVRRYCGGYVPRSFSIILILSMLEMPCGDIWPMRVREDDWAAVLRSPKCRASQVI
ncbi:hypothetical protein F383_31335 [Gossypium arboreum]|uniref:Uncharacterized protein n=1 Tax=Gossypium arboreum TaxID=29729 RepID=A0A0B0PI77_GOSAR|nr:hypothetical protein F383_31335 [Gossypium arboreum]